MRDRGVIGNEGPKRDTNEIWTTGYAEGFKGGVAFAENRKGVNCP